MYNLELHELASCDNDGVPSCSLWRRFGGTSGFKTLADVETRLIALADDCEGDWQFAFAVSSEGVGAFWWRLNELRRTGGATDLKLGFSLPEYKSAHYVRPPWKLLNVARDGQVLLKEAIALAGAHIGADPQLHEVVFYDSGQRSIVASFSRP